MYKVHCISGEGGDAITISIIVFGIVLIIVYCCLVFLFCYCCKKKARRYQDKGTYMYKNSLRILTHYYNNHYNVICMHSHLATLQQIVKYVPY